MQKPFPLNISKVTVIVLGRKIAHGQWMTPIHFRSKVKVTVAFCANILSAHYLDKLMSDSHCIW